MDPYGPRVRRLFRETPHAGTLADAITTRVDDQGISIELAARCADGRIQALRFRAWGCPHVIAAAEAFCAGYEGRSASDLPGFGAAEIMQSLPVPVEKTGRILVLEDAVRQLETALRNENPATD